MTTINTRVYLKAIAGTPGVTRNYVDANTVETPGKMTEAERDAWATNVGDAAKDGAIKVYRTTEDGTVRCSVVPGHNVATVEVSFKD